MEKYYDYESLEAIRKRDKSWQDRRDYGSARGAPNSARAAIDRSILLKVIDELTRNKNDKEG